MTFCFDVGRWDGLAIMRASDYKEKDRMIGKIICRFKGHILEQESITKTINQNNWCRKCLRCGRYVLHSDIGSVTIDEKSAMAFKSEFEKEMAWIDAKLKEVGADHECV